MSVVIGPVNAIRHPFMEEVDVATVVGPVESWGHPFRVVTEVPLRREVGGHVTYAFGTKWLYSELEIVPEEPVDAVVLWDPGWLRTGTGDGAKHEIRRVWELAQGWNAPLVGLYSDWFAAWKVDTGISGTLASLMYCDAIIVDPAGAAALRSACHPLRVDDPEDQRYRPIVEMNAFLSYGRLPRVGAEDADVEILPTSERDIDVAMVSTLHPQHVVLRPYYVEMLRRICERNGWRFEFRDRATVEEMEELYLSSKVVANVSLGSQPNCRVYEALACGALLVTDDWNIGLDHDLGNGPLDRIAPALRFRSVGHLENHLYLALGTSHYGYLQDAGLKWARNRSPEKTWARVLDAALEVAPRTATARQARRDFATRAKAGTLL